MNRRILIFLGGLLLLIAAFHYYAADRISREIPQVINGLQRSYDIPYSFKAKAYDVNILTGNIRMAEGSLASTRSPFHARFDHATFDLSYWDFLRYAFYGLPETTRSKSTYRISFQKLLLQNDGRFHELSIEWIELSLNNVTTAGESRTEADRPPYNLGIEGSKPRLKIAKSLIPTLSIRMLQPLVIPFQRVKANMTLSPASKKVNVTNFTLSGPIFNAETTGEFTYNNSPFRFDSLTFKHKITYSSPDTAVTLSTPFGKILCDTLRWNHSINKKHPATLSEIGTSLLLQGKHLFTFHGIVWYPSKWVEQRIGAFFRGLQIHYSPFTADLLKLNADFLLRNHTLMLQQALLTSEDFTTEMQGSFIINPVSTRKIYIRESTLQFSHFSPSVRKNLSSYISMFGLRSRFPDFENRIKLHLQGPINNLRWRVLQ